MYILYLFEAVYLSHDISLEKKGLECVCERFIYSHYWSAYSAAGKYVDGSWEYINHSQKH